MQCAEHDGERRVHAAIIGTYHDRNQSVTKRSGRCSLFLSASDYRWSSAVLRHPGGGVLAAGNLECVEHRADHGNAHAIVVLQPVFLCSRLELCESDQCESV